MGTLTAIALILFVVAAGYFAAYVTNAVAIYCLAMSNGHANHAPTKITVGHRYLMYAVALTVLGIIALAFA